MSPRDDTGPERPPRPTSARKLCPVPLCGADCRDSHLMCRDCWRRVPKRVQNDVNQSWSVYQRRRRAVFAFAVTCAAPEVIAARRRYTAASTAAIAAALAARP